MMKLISITQCSVHRGHIYNMHTLVFLTYIWLRMLGKLGKLFKCDRDNRSSLHFIYISVSMDGRTQTIEELIDGIKRQIPNEKKNEI